MSCLQMFYTYFDNIVDIHAPVKGHRVKNIKQPEWLSQEILQSIEMRDYYKKHGVMRPLPSTGRKDLNSLFRNQNHDTLLILLNRTETIQKFCGSY